MTAFVVGDSWPLVRRQCPCLPVSGALQVEESKRRRQCERAREAGVQLCDGAGSACFCDARIARILMFLMCSFWVAEWARMALHTDKSIKEQQRQADLFKKQQALNRREFLKAQEQEKIARDEKMNQVYANAVTGEYFSQWGTSHR